MRAHTRRRPLGYNHPHKVSWENALVHSRLWEESPVEMTLRVVLLLPRGWQSVGWSPVMVLSGPVLKGSRVFSLEGQNCIFFAI